LADAEAMHLVNADDLIVHTAPTIARLWTTPARRFAQCHSWAEPDIARIAIPLHRHGVGVRESSG